MAQHNESSSIHQEQLPNTMTIKENSIQKQDTESISSNQLLLDESKNQTMKEENVPILEINQNNTISDEDDEDRNDNVEERLINEEQEQDEQNSSIFVLMRGNIFLILQYVFLYFTTSILLTSFIKFTVSYSNFRFPLTFLSLQMVLNTVICGIISFFIIKRRVTSVTYVNRSDEEGMSSVSAVPNVIEVYSHLFNWNSFKSLAPFGILTGFDYACSTFGLKFITISLYTMLKSSVPVFVMIISFIFKLERVKFILIVSIVLISIGVGMTSKGTIHFDIIGFVLVMVAVVFTALRLVIAQYILQKSNMQIIYTRLSSAESLDSPITPTITNENVNQQQQQPTSTSIETDQTFEYFYARDGGEQFRASKVEISSVQIFFYTAPVIALTVLPFAMLLELKSIITVFSNLEQSSMDEGTHNIHMLRFVFILKFIGMIFVGSLLGIVLNISEFLLIKQTSSLTLTVLSIFKELLMISIAVMIFGDHIGLLGYIGYGLCLVGLVIYKIHRFLDSKSSTTSH